VTIDGVLESFFMLGTSIDDRYDNPKTFSETAMKTPRNSARRLLDI
jgi:hypothetical protein